MKEDKSGRHEDRKVLPIDKFKRSGQKETGSSEPSVHQLLAHMREVRESVPVNKQLQEDLRRNLFSQDVSSGGKHPPAAGTTKSKKLKTRRFPRWLLVGMLTLVGLLAVFTLWYKSAETVLQPVGSPTPVANMWNVDANLSFEVSPQGDILAARHGQLLWVQQESSGQYRTLDLPAGWLYHSPSFSPDGEKVALVRQRQGGVPQIVICEVSKLEQNMAREDFQILVTGEHDVQFRYLAWSPRGAELAFTEIGPGELNKVKTADINGEVKTVTPGMHPTWAPDGKKMVVQRSGAENGDLLFLIDIEGNMEKELGQGEQPYWGKNGYLAFVVATQTERVLTFMPDGSPQFTVRQSVGEIRSVDAGRDGKALLQIMEDPNDNWLTSSILLVSPDGAGSGTEMDWLQQMELEGVREPRVLQLNAINRCQGPVISAQGDSLFFTRQDEGTASVLRLGLEERLPKRGEN